MISLIGMTSASAIDDNTTSYSANDNNNIETTSNSINSNNNNILSTSTGNSFKDLESDIEGHSEVNLTKDYVFDKTTDSDYYEGIELANISHLVINGNNHIIDGGNLASIFDIDSSNVVLNNIIFKNSNNTTLDVFNSTVNSTNNTYVNEFNTSRAITAKISEINTKQDRFIDNYKEYGSSIYGLDSKLYVENGTFNNKNELAWSSIYVEGDSEFYIVNSTFTNISSKYAPAIYFEKSGGIIHNCKFENLYANLTGGAIAAKELDKQIFIINSTFTNTTSANNGGAAFMDVSESAKIIIINSTFDSCQSMFGGAYLQLGGSVTIINTTFRNNYALLSGGAIYTSYADLYINDTLFDSNSALEDMEYYYGGGAIYADKAGVLMNNDTFINNYASTGEDIYLYDGEYIIKNSYFDGNIHTFFDYGRTLENNTFVKNNNKFNDTLYPYVYEGPGNIIDYDPVILDESLVNNSYFNLNDYGLVTKVKDQGNMGACWAFGTAGSLESAILKATNGKLVLDISENNIQNLGLRYNMFGNNLFAEGGHRYVGSSYFLSWLGVTNVEDDAYDELGKISPIIDNGSKYFVYNVIYIEPRQNMTDNQKIKEALVKYGAVAISLCGATSDSPDYNKKTYAAYHNSTFGYDTDHTVTLVGWNDTYSKDNFNTAPPGDGAWIIKNSWGEDWGDNGYYYVSYYDTAFATNKTLAAFTIDDKHNYERNYQYDIITFLEFDNSTLEEVAYLNKFTAVEDELICAVGTYFNESGVNYTITIDVDEDEVYEQNGTSKHYGYETIVLDQKVGVKENHTFVIEIESNKIPMSTNSRQHYQNNVSFVNFDKIYDSSYDKMVPALKAYTVTDKSYIDANNITTNYKSNKYIQVTYHDKNGDIITNTNVSFVVNNKTYTKTTNSQGIAVLDEDFEPGVYTVTVINPENLEKTNITLTVIGDNTDNRQTDNDVKVATNRINKHTYKQSKQLTRQTDKQSYSIYKHDTLIDKSNVIRIETLNIIFNTNFTNGQLLVYIDGILVFNDTTTNDIYTIILEITEKLLGQHELKVVFTDANNKTNTYVENITISG